MNTCYICDTLIGAGSTLKNSYNLFGDTSLQSGKNLSAVASEIIEKPVDVKGIHSKVICMKCHRRCVEYDSIKVRLQLIKSEVLKDFKKTLFKHNLNYLTYDPSKESKSEKKANKKGQLVLPASKLQPLPPNFVFDVGKVPTSSPKKVAPTISKIKNDSTSATLNLKVTVGTSVLTQSIKTTASVAKPNDLLALPKHNQTPSVSLNQKPMLTFTIDDLPKDFLSSSMLTKVIGDKNKDKDDNNEQAMEIDEDCSLRVIPTSSATTTNGDIEFLTENKSSLNKDKLEDYLNVELVPMTDSSEGGKFILGKLQIMDDQDDDEEDSNDESQIELQLSGDEETANAIIAAAQEQGGAFIKVESGEMFQVKSVQSATDDTTDVDTQNMLKIEDGIFKCLLCEKDDDKERESVELSKRDALWAATHLRRRHGLRARVCPHCGAALTALRHYTAHIEEHMKNCRKNLTDKIKLHECTVCKKKYSSRTMLNEHMNVHSGTRPYTCHICDKSFASKYTHQAHLKIHLDRPRPFKCTKCDKSFLTLNNLNQHEKTHSGVKDFICNICGKAFGTQHNLEMHGVVHSGSRPFVCGVCGKGFARRAEVRDHMRVHTGERPFKCELCEASFSQRSNLHSHRRARHLDDKRYHCTQCPKRFKRRRLLDYHIKASHTGERPLKCEMCRATFVYPEHYKKHIRIHSGEKPYVCEVCGKSFNSRDNRNTHRFVHSDKKPYECVVCGAGYMRKQLLYAHMNTSGHLAESIVVNQPRVQKVEEIYEATEELDNDPLDSAGADTQQNDVTKLFITEDKNFILQDCKGTINIVQENEDSTLLSLQNIETTVKPDTSMMEEVNVEDFEQAQVVASEDGGVLRLVQVQLDDGNSGWVAIE